MVTISIYHINIKIKWLPYIQNKVVTINKNKVVTISIYEIKWLPYQYMK